MIEKIHKKYDGLEILIILKTLKSRESAQITTRSRILLESHSAPCSVI